MTIKVETARELEDLIDKVIAIAEPTKLVGAQFIKNFKTARRNVQSRLYVLNLEPQKKVLNKKSAQRLKEMIK